MLRNYPVGLQQYTHSNTKYFPYYIFVKRPIDDPTRILITLRGFLFAADIGAAAVPYAANPSHPCCRVGLESTTQQLQIRRVFLNFHGDELFQREP